MSTTRNVDRLDGRLIALQRIAEQGAAFGWLTLPPLIAVMVRVALGDLARKGDDDNPRVEFQFGWAEATLEVAREMLERPDGLPDFVRRAVLDAEVVA